MTSSPENPADRRGGCPAGLRSARSAEELAQTERLETYYDKATSTVLQTIERSVCGCSYGGCSWTTRAEAEGIAALLELRPGRRLLDVGAGSGWPGLYMAQTTGCDVTLVDLPLAGLRIAAERAITDALPGTCWVVVGDGADLPFANSAFDAISHSDVLCCLRDKRGVLRSCRRVLEGGGTMAFSVISLAPGLSGAVYRRAVECGPEFIECDADYPTLLEQTGWQILQTQDVSEAFAQSSRRMREVEAEHADELQALLGPDGYAERKSNLKRHHSGAEEGLIRREIFLAAPA